MPEPISILKKLRRMNSDVPPEYWHEDCVLCQGDGCEECTEEEEEVAAP